jgi:WD40 repeat protein
MKPAHIVEGAHSQQVRGLDYNPNKPYVVLSCGDDYAIRYWDLRKPSAALLGVKAHSHWTTCALYNRFHDQLVLSCGTDYQVKLWRAASISSAPPTYDAEEPELGEADADGLVKVFDEHEQSVFSAAWSAADAWIFASLSLDGKVVINHVPPAEKYKILL